MDRILGKLFGHKPASPADPRQQIEHNLESRGLGQISQDVLRMAQPSIRISAAENQGSPSQPGASRLGGQPDLPAGTEWPSWKGVPMSFVGQVRLEEIAALDGEHVFPNSGLLSFFYDAKQETYGADPQDRGGWQVQYHSGDPTGWTQLAFPAALPTESRFKPLSVQFSSELTFPSDPKQAQPDLNWPDKEIESYENWLVERFTPEQRGQPHHRMLGYPDQIQDDMQLECALAAHGFANQDAPGADAAMRDKGDWLLLLQVDSDERTGMRWGSAGRIYYWIERPALHDQHFDQAWLVLQSD